MNPLQDLLARRAADTSERIFVAGAWITRIPTIPLDLGLEGIVRFAERCWKRNNELQAAAFKADRQLAIAEAALANLVTRYLDTDVAIALTAVKAAREVL